MARHPDPYVRRVAIAASMGVAAILLALAVWAASHMLLLIFGGVLLAVLLRALADALGERTGIPTRWTLWMVFAALAGVLLGGGWYLWADLASQFDELGRSLTSIWNELRAQLEKHSWGQQVLAVLGDAQASQERASALGKFFGAVLGGISGLVISIFIGLYLAADPTLYRRGALRLVPMAHRPRAAALLDELHHTLRLWLTGTFVLMLLVGTMTTLGLWLLGIPLALALGLIAFALEFIPYVGPILAALPAMLIASTVGTREVLLVALLYWAIQSLEGYVLSPLVYSRSVHIPPMITISAQVVLGTVLGVLGIVFATPLAACGLVLVRRLYVESALGDRLDRPVTD